MSVVTTSLTMMMVRATSASSAAMSTGIAIVMTSVGTITMRLATMLATVGMTDVPVMHRRAITARRYRCGVHTGRDIRILTIRTISGFSQYHGVTDWLPAPSSPLAAVRAGRPRRVTGCGRRG